MGVSENRVPRKILEPYLSVCEKLHNEEPHNLYSKADTVG